MFIFHNNIGLACTPNIHILVAPVAKFNECLDVKMLYNVDLKGSKTYTLNYYYMTYIHSPHSFSSAPPGPPWQLPALPPPSACLPGSAGAPTEAGPPWGCLHPRSWPRTYRGHQICKLYIELVVTR